MPLIYWVTPHYLTTSSFLWCYQNTNVVKLYECLKKDHSQKTYYSSGVGTFAKPSWDWVASLKEGVISAVDLAVAKNLKNVILNAYRWLADTYQPGDQIFLFGFSRGAYQVRALAAMIECVGLIHAGNLQQIPFAWELYSTPTSDKQSYREKLAQFKSTFSHSVGIHFLGAWDTVSSVGIIRGKLLPLAMKNHHIEHFRHALALDECRVKFLPEYAKDVNGGTNTSKNVWFAGTHSEIGGKTSRHGPECGAEPLYWMMDEARQLGLKLRRQDIPACLLPTASHKKSLGAWWPLEYLPIRRASPKPDNMSYHSRLPHRGKGRRIVSTTHKMHWSVFASAKDPETRYNPQAVIKQDDNTLTLREVIENQDLDAKEFCEAGYNNIQVLQLLRNITRIIEKPQTGESLDGPLNRLLVFARSGQTKIIWTYGGPQFILKLMTINGVGYGNPLRAACDNIVYAVMDPTYHVQWEEHLEMFAEGRKLVSKQNSRPVDEVDQVILPRLHDLLKFCQQTLEPPEPNPMFSSKLWTLPKPKISTKSTGPGQHTYTSLMLNKLAAVELILLVLEKFSKLLGEYGEDMDQESTFIKDIPTLLSLPLNPEHDFTETATIAVASGMVGAMISPEFSLGWRNRIVYRVVEVIIEITNLKCGHCRQRLCDGDIAQRLLPWIKHWGLEKLTVTPELLGAVRSLADDSRIAIYLVHAKFTEDMLRYLTENKNGNKEDNKKLKQILGLLAKLTNTDHHAFDEAALSEEVKDETISHSIRNCLQLPNIISNIKQVLLGSEVPVAVTEGKARASIRLITELARHANSRKELIAQKAGVFGTLARLLEDELGRRQAEGEPLGPIAGQFFQALPVFVLYPELRYKRLAEVGVKLVELVGSHGSEYINYNSDSKIAALKYLLGNDEDGYQGIPPTRDSQLHLHLRSPTSVE
ncbi:unnamed protein product [Rhizoctonia solani]|nr:unnamed protein product [Rhizoctonia solani]